MSKVYLIRGPSGAGKSTFVKTIHREFVICSADNFFMVAGEYKFDANLLSRAHNQCMKDFLNALSDQQDVIVVDNTFTKIWELDNYVRAARLRGYDVEIVELEVKTVDEIRLCAKRNVHQVPLAVVARMAAEFETAVGIYNQSSVVVKTVPIGKFEEVRMTHAQ